MAPESPTRQHSQKEVPFSSLFQIWLILSSEAEARHPSAQARFDVWQAIEEPEEAVEELEEEVGSTDGDVRTVRSADGAQMGGLGSLDLVN